MLIKRGYQAELDLNNEQITACRKHCGAARWAYNYGLRRKQEAYKAGLPTPYATDLHREMNALKKNNPLSSLEAADAAASAKMRPPRG